MRAQDHGAAEATRWYLANCNPECCARKEAEAEPMVELIGHYRHVDGLLAQFPPLAPGVLAGWSPVELRRLAMVRNADRMTAERERDGGDGRDE